MEIDKLAELISRTRGSKGIRATAKEIGISPTTLSRIERGHIPDLRTLDKVCEWLGVNPTNYTGIGGLQIAFKKKTAVSSATAKSLAALIEKSSQQFIAKVEAEGH